MRIFTILIFLFISFSLKAQKNDLLILDRVKYKGKLLNYSKSDIRNTNSGKLSFFIYKLNDTLHINTNRNIKIKINKYTEFYEFTTKSWNNVELGIANTGLSISKGFFNKKYFNIGFGIGVSTIDRINFIPIYIKNFYDFYPLNRQSTYKLFADNKLGFSFGEDFGNDDYIFTKGGFFWNPAFGIKKSSGKKHISLKFGYLLQGYSSEHNNWWWDQVMDIFIPGQNISEDIIRRDGYFKRMTMSFSVFF